MKLIDETLRAFLERGCAMIVGTVADDGAPHAQRAWGCGVVAPDRVRVLLDAEDRVLVDQLEGRGRIAITGADVRTLASVQLKGQVDRVEAPRSEDLERCRQHNEELFEDILATDHYPREYTERMVPAAFVVAVVQVEEVYDQTPGPGAGAPVHTA